MHRTFMAAVLSKMMKRCCSSFAVFPKAVADIMKKNKVT